ncbi:hypothetical protein ACFOG5_05045 [Pedobacter fastidiosus]|uniref:Uncharacterized protein n=1 Tax=Pedobacter fastidiosus TaxID=2765361 RepID=A0ABR7KQV9_9SPHI|nr:hypothetical protein [Pedobacter fastidiosus]MBC6110486.1 hypothetical protein [Pedobacter fastidiosus]
MKVKETMIFTLKNGEKALILLAENEEEQEKLYHHLTVDAYKFKNEIAETEPRIDYISSGYRNEKDEVTWNNDYIPVPKWFEKN